MDGDPAVEPELDSFSLAFPLPYRVAVIIVLAAWAWGANLQYLSLMKIDVPALIRYPSRTSSKQPAHYFSTYRLATTLSSLLGLSILTFWVFTHGSAELVKSFDFLPILTLVVIFSLFFLPFQSLSRSGRYRFLATLKRVSVGGIATNKNGKFGDVILADVLTSYAKVLADLFVSLCMFLTPGTSATAQPNRGCGGQFLVPLIIALPSMIRFRQCIIEYLRVQNANKRSGSTSKGWGGQHLANALKYSTAFPVIILSALQRSLSFNHTTVGVSETTLFRMWLISVVINSLYSFYWDVAKDWDLTLFALSRERNSPDHPWGLRRRLIFRFPEVYYAAIFIDFLLRCTWSLKLSPHLDHFNDLEGGIFVIQLLEVGRRWLWIYFRVETEWLRNSPNGGDEILLLSDYLAPKDDDD